MLRCFEDDDVTHVEGRVDPVADAETVETELMLADLASLERRVTPLRKRAQAGDKEAKAEVALMEPRSTLLADGKPARLAEVAEGRGGRLSGAQPADRQAGALRLQRRRGRRPRPATRYSAAGRGDGGGGGRRLRRHLGRRSRPRSPSLPTPSSASSSTRLGLEEPGLDRVIRAGYDLLGLITYFTAGPKEARAWTIAKGTKAPQAAGAIHTDFERGFIRAQTIAYDDYRRPRRRAGRPRKPARRATRARTTSSRTAT